MLQRLVKHWLTCAVSQKEFYWKLFYSADEHSTQDKKWWEVKLIFFPYKMVSPFDHPSNYLSISFLGQHKSFGSRAKTWPETSPNLRDGLFRFFDWGGGGGLFILCRNFFGARRNIFPALFWCTIFFLFFKVMLEIFLGFWPLPSKI